jgi:Zn-dependent M32 family carboxypeptidase
MNKTRETKGGHTTGVRAVASSCRRNPQSAEIKLGELRRRLLEINDLRAAGALLSWDHATYMPKCGAIARARQGAIVSRLAHEKLVATELGNLFEELEPYAASLPYDSNTASLLRVTRRDFERAIKVPSDYVARVSAFGATAYEPGNERDPRRTLRPWCHFWKELSILVASTQTFSPPTSMSLTLSLMMPTKA